MSETTQILSHARDTSVDTFNVYNASHDIHFHAAAADFNEQGEKHPIVSSDTILSFNKCSVGESDRLDINIQLSSTP